MAEESLKNIYDSARRIYDCKQRWSLYMDGKVIVSCIIYSHGVVNNIINVTSL